MKFGHLKIALVSLSIFLFQSLAVASLKFAPISLTFTPEGKGAHQFATVMNDGKENIPVLIRLSKRILQEDGNEQLPSTTDFSVYPPQFVLKPNEKKVVKISWLGPKEIPHELSYRIQVEQLPVELKKQPEGSGIKVLVNYSGTLYVLPANTKPDILVKEASYNAQDRKLHVLVANEGTRHEYLKEVEFTVEGQRKGGTDTQTTVIKGDVLKDVEGTNLLAKSARLVKLNWPSSMNEKAPLKVTVKYKIQE